MIRVACADDHPLVRRGVAGLISSDPDMILVGQASDGDTALELCLTHHVDVLILDLRMPGRDPIEVIADLAARTPPVRVLVLTTFATDEAVLRSIRAGARGFLTKASLDDEILAAVRRLADNGRAVPPAIADQLACAVTSPSLTAREHDILLRLADGLNNKSIARTLGISPATVKVHVQNLLEKLGCHDRTAAVMAAQRRGILDRRSAP